MSAMKKIGIRLSLIACSAMVSLQVVGAHLHVNAADHHKTSHHAPHLEHSIATDHSSDGHDDHLDVPLPDSALKAPKADSIILDTVHFYEIIEITGNTRWFVLISNAPPHRFYRLNPPLRAPPLPA